jgi:hypothetical protein
MLGSVSEAADVVQERWLRISRPDTSSVENPGGQLTRVVAPCGRLMMVLGFAIRYRKIVAIGTFAAPQRLAELELAVLDE